MDALGNSQGIRSDLHRSVQGVSVSAEALRAVASGFPLSSQAFEYFFGHGFIPLVVRARWGHEQLGG